MKITPMHLRNTALTVAAVLVAAIIAMLGAWWSAVAIEGRSAAAVRSHLLTEGITWATVEANGLQVRLSGIAPNEAARFRAVNMVGTVVQSSRVRDDLEVTAVRGIEAPRFSLEMLRNDDGISLIGLLPGKAEDQTLTQGIADLAQGVAISDMLETADYPAPATWQPALDFGLAALRMLPRSKISVSAEAVSITAISASADEKRKLEADLARLTPKGLKVTVEVSAPRPVLTPFTFRVVKDDAGTRFDACSADTDRARDRILAAGKAAGVPGNPGCTVGLGVPTPRWADAATAGIRALAELPGGTITFSDADVTLLAASDTTQAEFDRVVGDLQARLPEVFSVNATLAPKETARVQGPAEFTATLSDQGQVELRGRLTDEVLRDAVDSFARAHFGADRVYTATRLDGELPDGWPVRVLAGIESLAMLHDGRLLVRPDLVEVTGVTGKPDGRAQIAQILSGKLGQGQTFRVNVSYNEKFDPLAALPTPQECVARLNTVMAQQKITFAPGSAETDDAARKVIDALAEVLANCPSLEMEIAGHTDSQGSEGGNRALSQARAEAVLVALQGRRLPVGDFVAKGYGEERPLEDNATEAGREANRRIEFILLSAPEPVAAPSPVAAAEAAVAAMKSTADQIDESASAATGGQPVASVAPGTSATAPATPPTLAPKAGDDQVAQVAVDPVNGVVRSVAVPAGEAVLPFAPTEETWPRPRRRP